MSTDTFQDPKIAYALYKLEDTLAAQRENPHPDFQDIVTHKDGVLKRYGEVFRPARLPHLTRAEFESFLLFRNNHHWDSLHRVGKYMVEDMDLLREALAILVDESQPVASRLNQLRPERYWGAHSMVSHLGTPVLTAILQVVYPDKYGVWNNTSDAGLKIVRLWEKRWETGPTGESYAEMNAIYQRLAQALHIDLWTLDALWWVLKGSAKTLTRPGRP